MPRLCRKGRPQSPPCFCSPDRKPFHLHVVFVCCFVSLGCYWACAFVLLGSAVVDRSWWFGHVFQVIVDSRLLKGFTISVYVCVGIRLFGEAIVLFWFVLFSVSKLVSSINRSRCNMKRVQMKIHFLDFISMRRKTKYIHMKLLIQQLCKTKIHYINNIC